MLLKAPIVTRIDEITLRDPAIDKELWEPPISYARVRVDGVTLTLPLMPSEVLAIQNELEGLMDRAKALMPKENI